MALNSLLCADVLLRNCSLSHPGLVPGKNKIVTKMQSGFRKRRSATDQLIHLETFVREAFIQKQHTDTAFFDLEKAYDTTWKYGIMQDLFNAGFRGCLPLFIQGLLQNRQIFVGLGYHKSDLFDQEMRFNKVASCQLLCLHLRLTLSLKILPRGCSL